ncbi:disintegrin and metalloproteinase domain-containing protein 10 [Caerostris extrusa]|uniref:ADAM10 endopeptidase n=1 Tax=Caerostris extrusa TaxID=172846 RepID=A0AAV4N2M7_CAEEX|nr:disintegrin and metalloproteinase domain-containing protein 10 [Caerostris extrusa]
MHYGRTSTLFPHFTTPIQNKSDIDERIDSSAYAFIISIVTFVLFIMLIMGRLLDFDQDGRPDNISFLIKRIKVHTRPDDPDYRFVGSYGVEKFLELFSEDDYDAFCLAYMFTYRDFEGGTLGLAWTGDLKNAGGHYRGSLKSLNTGIITLLNYGKHVPPVVSHVTLAHEIGHNFGSPHDPEDDLHCTPGGDHGNYIMFARATSGDKKNNNKFSPCSLRSINAVLNTKARSVKGCFTEPLDAVCGNEVVEGAEECDCGWEEDCHEPCCFPMRVNPTPRSAPCRLRPAAFCSPSQGPCCSHDCQLKYGVLCREDNGCRTASHCEYPFVRFEEFVCYNGECTGSICMAYGLESCQCIRSYHDPLIRSCELCCKLPGDELSCKSSFEWNLPPYDVPDLYAKPGAPCDNYNGYCDVHQSCREIDPSGPLATLRNLLMSLKG